MIPYKSVVPILPIRIFGLWPLLEFEKNIAIQKMLYIEGLIKFIVIKRTLN